MGHEGESFPVQAEALGPGPAVVDRHRLHDIGAFVQAGVAAAHRGDIDRDVLGTGEVFQRRLDELGCRGRVGLTCQSVAPWSYATISGTLSA